MRTESPVTATPWQAIANGWMAVFSCLVKGFTFGNPNFDSDNDHGFTKKNSKTELVRDDADKCPDNCAHRHHSYCYLIFSFRNPLIVILFLIRASDDSASLPMKEYQMLGSGTQRNDSLKICD